MLLFAMSILVVAQSNSEIPEGLMNNSVYLRSLNVRHLCKGSLYHCQFLEDFSVFVQYDAVLSQICMFN